MQNSAQLLAYAAISEIPNDFLVEGSWQPKASFITAPYRVLDLSTLDKIMMVAADKGPEPELDRWLAPRVHSALRLTRAEASDRRLWAYLGVVKYPQYVRQRHGKEGKTAPIERFAGPGAKQALARLWWTAELARNGKDYSDVVRAFTPQEVPNTGLKSRCFRHRPTAIALARVCTSGKDGAALPGRQINKLFKALNTALGTTVLQALAPDPGVDQLRVGSWIAGVIPSAAHIIEAPSGPDEPGVEAEAISCVQQFVTDLGRSIGVLE